MFQEGSFIRGSDVLPGPAQQALLGPHPNKQALFLPDLQGFLLPDFLCQFPNQSPVLIELQLRVLVHIQALHLLIQRAHILRCKRVRNEQEERRTIRRTNTGT